MRIFINSSFKISTLCLPGTHLVPWRRTQGPAVELQSRVLVTHFLLACMETDVSEKRDGQIETYTAFHVYFPLVLLGEMKS